MFGGSNHYINQEVTVHSRVNAETPVQIGSFRLIDISTDGDKVSLSLTSHRPWHFITLPQKQSDNGVYQPIAYGNFTSNSPTSLSLTKDMYPMPFVLGGNGYRYISTNTVTGGSKPHYYDKNGDIFMQLTEAGTGSDSFSGVDTFVVDSILKRKAIFRPVGISGSGWDSNGNAIDTDVDSYAESSASLEADGRDDEDTITMDFEIPQIAGKLNIVKIYTKWRWHIISSTDGSGADVYPRVTWVTSFAGTDAGQAQATGTVADVYMYSSGSMSSFDGGNDGWDGNYDVIDMLSAFEGNDNSLPSSFSMTFKVQTDYISDDIEASIRMYDVYLEVEAQSDPDNEPSAASEAMEKLKFIYSGNDGLVHGITDILYYDNTITDIHEAHLDLLNRFTGLDSSDLANTIDGWGDLMSARSGWDIRWWEEEEIELKKILEKLQYEGCFIFRYKADGSPQYIHIPDSPSADHSLTKNDIKDFSVKHTPFSELLTKMELSYEKHPAENRYISTATKQDTTARANWNIQAKENIKQIKLDALVDNVASNFDGDPNDGFVSYYANIFGDIKIQVSGAIVNPIFYGMEVGDIVDFSSMHPTKAFGESWSGKNFIITGLTRSVGTLKFDAREI